MFKKILAYADCFANCCCYRYNRHYSNYYKHYNFVIMIELNVSLKYQLL